LIYEDISYIFGKYIVAYTREVLIKNTTL
jgi:hypothetical protein